MVRACDGPAGRASATRQYTGERSVSLHSRHGEHCRPDPSVVCRPSHTLTHTRHAYTHVHRHAHPINVMHAGIFTLLLLYTSIHATEYICTHNFGNTLQRTNVWECMGNRYITLGPPFPSHTQLHTTLISTCHSDRHAHFYIVGNVFDIKV